MRSEWYDFVDKETVDDPGHGVIRIMRFRERSKRSDLEPKFQYEGPAEIPVGRNQRLGVKRFPVDVQLTRYGKVREAVRNIWFSGMDKTKDEPVPQRRPTPWDGHIIHMSDRNFRSLHPDRARLSRRSVRRAGALTAIVAVAVVVVAPVSGLAAPPNRTAGALNPPPAPSYAVGKLVPPYDVPMTDPTVTVGSHIDYLYTGAGGYDPPNISVRAFTDLEHLSAEVDAMPALPPWTTGWTSAPDVRHVDGRYVMWFSSPDVDGHPRDRGSGQMHRGGCVDLALRPIHRRPATGHLWPVGILSTPGPRGPRRPALARLEG